MTATGTGWQPVVHMVVLCGHTRQTGLGFVTDCNERAAFVRATEHGGHEYACGRHVAEMNADLEATDA